MSEITRNSDLLEEGVDEFAGVAVEKKEKRGRKKKSEK